MRALVITPSIVTLALLAAGTAHAAVSAEEAAKLKSDLTPVGAERAGNKAGTIPAWTGGLTKPTPGFKNGGRRPDPFADEKPITQITAKNMDAYSDKLTDGVKALLKKYPDSYRLDVYKTHRTAALPQWVYDNTLTNATRATVGDSDGGPVSKNAFGGFPFPIPKNGEEVILNTKVRWRGDAWKKLANNYQVTSDGRPILLSKITQDNVAPYYFKEGSADKFEGHYWNVRLDTHAPAIRAGEAIIGQLKLDESQSNAWVYLVGQRRVRKLPNACCDTPTPAAAGLAWFDEVETFNYRLDRYDWKLVGKKEMFIPYNSNRTLVPTKDSDVLGPKHLNPDHVRWELHRVWVVEAALKPGQRHAAPKSRYYIDEDSWWPVLADRWDAKGQLWRTGYSTPVAMPDLPGQVGLGWGVYDLLAGNYVAMELVNEQPMQYQTVSPRYKESHFSPENLGGAGVR
ncbi:DUF1329 domain-containing protein [Aquabacterium sp.]|uniref:DUF1329 domain-containing protein n=1 Tax=Aquabacterium sp. TaxID=1872578 RepID=UPI003BAEAE74